MVIITTIRLQFDCETPLQPFDDLRSTYGLLHRGLNFWDLLRTRTQYEKLQPSSILREENFHKQCINSIQSLQRHVKTFLFRRSFPGVVLK